MAKKEQVSPEVEKWAGHIAGYEREFKDWESRVVKILKRYRDENRKTGDDSSKFNILWSNVQTLSAATFAKLPKPDVSRRFKDNDQVGRVASLILERALEYEVQKYNDYASMLRASIYDRFLGGRGTAWVRYEPHFKSVEQGLPVEGDQISEDQDKPGEELDYECSPCDYVHWRDFGHTVARTWEEVTAVWRIVYLTREQCIERFGEELGKKIPLDSKPDDEKNKQAGGDENRSRAKIYEIWDKQTKTAIWMSPSMKQVLDEKPDPLGLEDFFPCPKPLFATLTNDKLVPVPDFYLYQDQAVALDVICDRIDGLIKALKVTGGYDASIPALARIFTEGSNGTLIPVKEWAAFAEKNGLQGAISLVDLKPIAEALREAYGAMEQIKGQIYEITGISDIIRGQTQASETATAQQIKGQYASLRLKQYQEEVARYATEVLQIKAQIICGHFSPDTILKISCADQLSEADRKIVPQALELLIGPERAANPDSPPGPNPMRSFRIEIAADTLVYLDEQAEKESRTEFLTAVGSFMANTQPIVAQAPQMLPLMSELLKFAVRGFKVGKTVEAAFEETIEQLKQNPVMPQQELEQRNAEIDQKAKQVEQAMMEIENSKKELMDRESQLMQTRTDIEKAALELDKKGLELDKKGLEIGAKEQALGFREEAFGLEQNYTKSVTDIQSKFQEATRLKEEADVDNTLSNAAKDLAQIAENIKTMSEASVEVYQEAASSISQAVQQLNESIQQSMQPRKKRAKVTKGPDGVWTSEELPEVVN